MTARERLWYLINGVINGSYDVRTFCDEFYRIYNFETDYTKLSEKEHFEFKNLFMIIARFSDSEKDIKIKADAETIQQTELKLKETKLTLKEEYQAQIEKISASHNNEISRLNEKIDKLQDKISELTEKLYAERDNNKSEKV